MSSQHPLVNKFQAIVLAAATAAGVETPVARAPFAGKIVKVAYIPSTTITGVNTNTRKVSLLNKGGAGTGVTVVATKQFNQNVNAAAFDETILTLSSTAADLVVAEGDILSFKSEAVGTGLADPGGLVLVEISRD